MARLFRPVGKAELALIRDSGWKRFPPRLPEQPIFYPVMNSRYAWELAKRWNEPMGDGAHVVGFEVRDDVASKYPVRTVGRAHHTELWVPAEDLEAFNDAIVGFIEELDYVDEA